MSGPPLDPGRLPRLAGSPAPGTLQRLSAERLIPGAGRDPIEHGAVLLDGDTILAAGADAEVPSPAGLQTVHFDGATLLPGLIDAHTHLGFAQGENLVDGPLNTPIAQSLRQAEAAARLVLAAGVTTVRDLGCRGRVAQGLRDAIVAGHSAGPRIVASGRPITSRRGHFWSFGIEISGPEQARRAVDTLVEDDADLIKVLATGGSLTPGTRMGRAQLDLAELSAVAERAHGLGRRVASHAHAHEGIAHSVAAGADTIEHCSWMDEEDRILAPDTAILARMRENGQMIVVAGPIPAGILEVRSGRIPGGAAHPEAARIERTQRSWANALAAHKAGVGVALGTDSLFGQFEDGHDLAWRAQALVEAAGWDPCDVIEAMTGAAARAIGAETRLGRLAPGAFADLLVVSGDPLATVADLHRIEAVYLGGRRVGPA